MNDLVKRLSEKEHPIQANRPDTTGEALKERIDLNYVHILFEETGTEIGIKLDRSKCDLSKADFVGSNGDIRLEGALTLNYEKVRCIAEFSLKTMKGKGKLQPIENEEEYRRIIDTE